VVHLLCCGRIGLVGSIWHHRDCGHHVTVVIIVTVSIVGLVAVVVVIVVIIVIVIAIVIVTVTEVVVIVSLYFRSFPSVCYFLYKCTL